MSWPVTGSVQPHMPLSRTPRFTPSCDSGMKETRPVLLQPNPAALPSSPHLISLAAHRGQRILDRREGGSLEHPPGRGTPEKGDRARATTISWHPDDRRITSDCECRRELRSCIRSNRSPASSCRSSCHPCRRWHGKSAPSRH